MSMTLPNLMGALLGLGAGATMSVAVSCAWAVLHLPARLQDVFQAGSPRLFSLALLLGMLGAALGLTPGLHLTLPVWCGSLGVLLAGVFVGMLASALEKILEVAPVLLRRFRIPEAAPGIRWVMLAGKAVGALLGCLLYP